MATKATTTTPKNPIHEDTRRRQEIATENACAERWETKWGFMKTLYETPVQKEVTPLTNNSTSIVPVKADAMSKGKNSVPADKFYIPATEAHQIGWAWTGNKLERFGRGDGHHITPEQVRQAFGDNLIDFKV